MSRPVKTSSSALDRTFTALADPTRRAILDALRVRGELTAGELAGRFPAISRPAVSKHLRLLREAGLVLEERTGRYVNYRLPDAYLAAPADAWLEPFRRAWQEKLNDLKRYVETGERLDQSNDSMTRPDSTSERG
ncbi:MAG: winged helix-turn-helix transcriptional regulator [Thermomicrobiales bacterium]|nr:winged helix-turn-helix transcriptional regulator [Thermomicrobiales bacterium]